MHVSLFELSKPLAITILNQIIQIFSVIQSSNLKLNKKNKKNKKKSKKIGCIILHTHAICSFCSKTISGKIMMFWDHYVKIDVCLKNCFLALSPKLSIFRGK